MKAAAFAYVRPATVDDVVDELHRGGGEGKVLAGGQSLVPLMAMRLVRPATLVDVNGVAGLDAVGRDGDHVVIGATARQRHVERPESPAAAVPLLRLALPWVGHRELRSRGTVCGSLAHADPAAELPAVAACLGAELEVSGPAGRRRVPAATFFAGYMTTVLAADELLTAARFPVARPGEGYGFGEFSRRHGDFALAGVAVRVRLDGGGAVTEAVLTAFGVSDRPVTRAVTAMVAEAAAAGGPIGDRLADPARTLADEMVDTAGDVHGSRDYRRRLIAGLAARELAGAYAAAEEASR